MKLVRVLLFLAGIALSSTVLAAGGTILYIPIDNRPVSLDYTVQTMQAAGWDVKIPPRDIIAGAEKGADAEQLFGWLEENAPESLAIVAASDALIYGGLVESRTHEIPLDTLKERAQRLVDLREKSGDRLIYIFTTIMRSPKMSGAPVEPAYYEEWGQKLFKLGALEDKLEAKNIKRKEVHELAELRKEIPKPVLDDMYTRRGNNIKTTELLLHGVESGDFDYLLIGRDDTAPYSQAHREARNMEILVNELPKEKIRFFSGADQLGMLLLCRASNKLLQKIPLVNVVYAPGKGGSTVPSYEDDTVAVSTTHHIYAAGAVPVRNVKNADLTVAVNTPYNGITADASDAVNNYTKTAELTKFIDTVGEFIKNEQAIAIADIKYGNGADNALITEIFDKGISYKLAAYSGWNTAGNSFGYALAQGILHEIFAGDYKKELLDVRYFDDWAYQANVRMQVYKELIWPNHWPNSGLSEDEKIAAQDKITSKIVEISQPLMGETANNYSFTLPWNRMFEVYVERK
ncbi:MAG: DUF4127 family protein [Phascolarctobacterium sp.]|nr:DUF4127 family protein [Phascolarctobacterium sp.]